MTDLEVELTKKVAELEALNDFLCEEATQQRYTLECMAQLVLKEAPNLPSQKREFLERFLKYSNGANQIERDLKKKKEANRGPLH